jgi:hypothetical protein
MKRKRHDMEDTLLDKTIDTPDTKKAKKKKKKKKKNKKKVITVLFGNC